MTVDFVLLRRLLLIGAFLTTALQALAADKSQSDRSNRYWPQWRGPLGNGVAPHAKPPVEWNEKKNIRWKTTLPGRGHSTPVVWGDRLFLTTAVPFGEKLKPRYSGAPGAHDNLPVTQRHKFIALAVNRGNGKILWQKTLHSALPHEGAHDTGSLASHSPVTDGKRLYVCFGSYGLYCLDLEGNLKWRADLGKMQTKHGHGEGSSPVLAGDALIVNWDHEGQSKVVAFDKRTGKERWTVKRREVTSWSTPIVITHKGKLQVVIPGTSRVRAYDPANGKVLWECGGLSANIVASPVAADGMVFIGSSYVRRALLAIRLDGAKGDITGSKHVVWNRRRSTPYVPSPLLYRGALYFLSHYQGVLTRVDAKTGKDRPGSMRLGSIRNVYSSPVAADGRVYVTDLDGTTMVISSADRPKVLARNRLDDSFSATAVIVGKELYLRGTKSLYCIAEK